LAIFPSEYIHIGGDEAGTSSWKNCPKCQALKKEKNLADEHELQAYLIKQLEAFLKSKGRKLIGWDEIINGGLPPDATVMSWRGEAGAITAAQQGHDVVMTPGETYLDAYQINPSTQRLVIFTRDSSDALLPQVLATAKDLDLETVVHPLPKAHAIRFGLSGF
jgi:hexosaminidase